MPRKPKQPSPPPVLAVVADCHVGNHARHGGPAVDGLNRRGRETVETLRRAVMAARRRACPHLVVAGDLFHSRRPEPAVLRAVQEVFCAPPPLTYLVPGNHDMLDASAAGGNTAMAPLHDQAYVEHAPGWLSLGAPGVHVLAVPFEGSVPMAEHLARVLREKCSPREERMVLVTHVGVWDEASASPWQRKARDGIEASVLARLMSDVGVSLAFVGNYHEPREWSFAGTTTIVQVGTLCPATHGDAGQEDRGRIAFLEADGSVSFEEVPGPRFVTAESWPYEAPQGTSFYVRWRGDPERVPEVRGQVVAVDVEEDLSSFPASSEGAKEEECATDEDAIRSFVGTMSLPEGASRDRVLEQALEHWRKA